MSVYNNSDRAKQNRQFSQKLQNKISRIIEEETRTILTSPPKSYSPFQANLHFEEFCIEKKNLTEEQLEEEISKIVRVFDVKKQTMFLPSRKSFMYELNAQIQPKSVGDNYDGFFRDAELMPLGRMNSENSLDYHKNDISLNESTSIAHHEKFLKRTGQEKLEMKEILAHLESKKCDKTLVNIESVEVEITFLFQYKKNIEKVRLFVASECTLGIVAEQLFSLINKGQLKFEHISIKKQLNSNNYEWKKVASEISNEMSIDNYQTIQIEEESFSIDEVLTESLLNWYFNKSDLMSQRIRGFSS